MGNFLNQCSQARAVHVAAVPPPREDLPEGTQVRDVIIIGSGPAGYTAGIYTARAMLQPLMFSGYAYGGQLMLTSEIENFPGFPAALGGPEFMDQLRAQAVRFGTEVVDKDVGEVDLSRRPFRVRVGREDHYARALIVSTGAEAQWLGAKDEDKVKGRGVSTCATCDGAFYKGKEVAVVGGGDAAMEEALFLTKFATKVTVLHRRDVFRASAIEYQRAADHPAVIIRPHAVVDRWLHGPDGLRGALVRDPRDGKTEEMHFDGAFLAIGNKPMTKFLGGQVSLDSEGYITQTEHTMTSIPGVFAAGDVVDKRYRQAVTAAGMGCAAALDAERWLAEHSS